MFQKSRRISASLVALTMLMTISSTAFAKEVTSSGTKTHWASGIMQRWVDYGIIKGSSSGDLRLDASITRAEVVTVINNTFGFVSKSDKQFSDVKTNSWYAGEMLKARNAGYYKGFPGNLSNADTKITRQDAAVIISNVFKINTNGNKLLSVSFKDSKDISSYAFNAVNKLSSDGIIKGYANGKFQPKSNITRAEFIAVMDNLAKLFTKAGSYDLTNIPGNAIVNAASAELKNTKVAKNLYITESVGNDGVTLNNVTVDGSLYLFGGKDTITIADTILNQLVVDSKNSKIIVTGKSKIKDLVLNTDASIIENPIISDNYRFEKVTVSSSVYRNQVINLSGNFPEVNILSEGAITFENGSIDKLQVNLPKNSVKPSLNIVSAVVKKLIVNNPTDLQVGPKAKVNLEINSDNVAINGKTVAKGIVKVENGSLKQTTTETTVEVPATVPNVSSGSGSSGSSGSSGGGSKGSSGSSGGGSKGSSGSSGGGSKGSSGSSSGNDSAPVSPETIITNYTFSSDLERWAKGNAVGAAFATPEIQQSNELGDGALKINAILTDTTKTKQQLMASVDSLNIINPNAVTFDMFLDSTKVDLVKYGNCTIKPSIILEPGKAEISTGYNDEAIKNWTKVKLANKEYLKYTVKNVINTPKLTKLTIVFESLGLSYTGPIYIDNVKISNFTGPVATAKAPSPTPIINKAKISTKGFDLSNVALADPNATKETASLFAYLRGIGGKSLLFGQQNATTKGLTTNGSTSGSESDVKNAVGAYPAVYEWDFSDAKSIDLVKVTKAAYDRNGIISLTANMPNFVTGGPSTDTKGDVISNILPGGKKNANYNKYLDDIANIANNVTVPMIFRPFNETDKGDYWWESDYCTPLQYKKLYRYTVDYLKNTKKVHNFLYCYSSNQDIFSAKYPGDPYVDILGLNIYDDNSALAFGEGLKRAHSELAENNIVAITEIGPNTSFKLKNNKEQNWFSGIVDIFEQSKGRISYAVVGANTSINQFCVPYRNHFLFGNNEMLQNFVNFYNHESIAFGNSLDGVYNLAVTRGSKVPYVFISGPIFGEVITGDTKVTAKVFADGYNVVSVQCNVAGKITDMKLDDNNDYTFTYTPSFDKDIDNLWIGVSVNLDGQKPLYDFVQVNYKYITPTPTPTIKPTTTTTPTPTTTPTTKPTTPTTPTAPTTTTKPTTPTTPTTPTAPTTTTKPTTPTTPTTSTTTTSTTTTTPTTPNTPTTTTTKPTTATPPPPTTTTTKPKAEDR